MERKHYYGIDWLRVMACIGIVMMHIQANNTYHLTGFIAERVIPSFTNFVFLFMTISALSLKIITTVSDRLRRRRQTATCSYLILL